MQSLCSKDAADFLCFLPVRWMFEINFSEEKHNECLLKSIEDNENGGYEDWGLRAHNNEYFMHCKLFECLVNIGLVGLVGLATYYCSTYSACNNVDVLNMQFNRHLLRWIHILFRNQLENWKNKRAIIMGTQALTCSWQMTNWEL